MWLCSYSKLTSCSFRLAQRYATALVPNKFSIRRKSKSSYEGGIASSSELLDHEILKEQYQLTSRLNSHQQQLIVVQPWCSHQDSEETPAEMMLEENLSLVRTLHWTVLESRVLKVKNEDVLFGVGQLKNLKELIGKHESNSSFISSVFISTYKLSSRQRLNLEMELKKPIIDRYSLILQIFQQHAQTKEAKLQVQLAEIPYLKARLFSDLEVENESKHSKQRKGRQWFDKQRLALSRREKRIKSSIEKMKTQRDVLRSGRSRDKLPVVAVVGYTNSGKTSLIKAMTGSDKVQPEDKLFATLDVTCHTTTMPSSLKVGFLDTVGFISDVPTSLIASFNATLEDAASADLLIHVRDVSNPNHPAQSRQVLQTLRSLNVPNKLLEEMITVGNKIDLLHPEDWQLIRLDGMSPVSTKGGTNMEELFNTIDHKLIQSTGRTRQTFRVPTGGDTFNELMRETFVARVEACQLDRNFSNVDCVLFHYQLKRFSPN